MIGNNIAGTLSQIGLRAVQPATVIDSGKDMGKAIQDSLKMYNDYSKKHAYIDALQGGDQEKIDSALASYNPEAYAQVMQAREQRANQLADADTQFARQKELADIQYNRSLALENLRNQNAIGLKQLEYQGLGGIEGFTPTGNPAYDKAVVAQLAKDNVEKAKALRQVAEMQPAVEQAMARADKAVDDGTGIGATSARGLVGDGFWGQLLSSKKADQNRTDIDTANSQMNSFLRSKLASTGLTGGELNSAAEAEAYRYTIKPNDSREQIAQKLKNFRNDYLKKSEPKIAIQASDPLGLR